MLRSRLLWGTACIAAWGLASFHAASAEPDAQPFYLRDGDRIVFYGDSITEQGHYARAVEEFVITRTPEIRVTFFNRGWAGDCAWGGGGGALEDRLARDVIPLKPTVLVVMFGMNDAYYMHHDSANVAAFKSNLERLLDVVRQQCVDVRITLLGTSPYDDLSPGDSPEWEQTIPGGYGAVVAHYSRAAEDVAADRKVLYVDMHEPIRSLLEKVGSTHPELVTQLIPDRIHPGPTIGLVMAAHLLAAWDAPCGQPKVDFHSLARVDNCHFVCTAARLPLPLDRKDPLTRLAVKHTPELRRISRNKMCINGFPGKFATLLIDGKKFGTFSAQQLAEGVDLSGSDTALNHAAGNVGQLTRLRCSLQFTRWRSLERQFPGDTPATAEQAKADLVDLEEQTITLQRRAAQPSSHRLTLVVADE